eukprot:2691502-Rhodomonas_salina.1
MTRETRPDAAMLRRGRERPMGVADEAAVDPCDHGVLCDGRPRRGWCRLPTRQVLLATARTGTCFMIEGDVVEKKGGS